MHVKVNVLHYRKMCFMSKQINPDLYLYYTCWWIVISVLLILNYILYCEDLWHVNRNPSPNWILMCLTNFHESFTLFCCFFECLYMVFVFIFELADVSQRTNIQINPAWPWSRLFWAKKATSFTWIIQFFTRVWTNWTQSLE